MTDETGDATKTRGRPRPEATIERDEKVLAHLAAAGPKTRKQLVEETGFAGNEIYLSLYRLSRANKIARTGSTWAVSPAPATE